MAISWIELVVKIVPAIMQILRQLDVIVDQVNSERRPEIDVTPARDALRSMHPEMQRITDRLNGELSAPNDPIEGV